VLVLVLAGGAGGRLEPSTEHRAKAAVPFAGVYRLIDFPLGNCQHAQLPDVWVSAQFHPVSLAEHLKNKRPWDLDRTTGGLMMLPPYRGTEREADTRAPPTRCGAAA
jgi:glucose-1-phosphate adenylyltransferase